MLHRRLLHIIVCRVDFDLFYGKVKFYNLGFSVGKSEKVDFSETIADFDLKLIKLVKICEY